MDARSLWKQFAQSDEGRQLAAQLEEVEDDQLTKQAELDKRINAALRKLAERMDNKPLVAKQKCEAETFYRSRYFHDHVELTMKMPVQMLIELTEAWEHYQDHNCGEAAQVLDAWTHALIMMMAESVPADVLMTEEEEEDGDDVG